MARLVWNKEGEHFYETGVDHGVLYVYDLSAKEYGKGVAWNGLTAVNNSPSGAEATPVYADNIKYLNLMSAEEYGCTIEALYSPKEFDACDGSAEIAKGVKIGQQVRQSFGFVYRTRIGNENTGELGYKLHIVYGAMAQPSEKNYQTVNDSPEAMTLSWEVKTTPVDVPSLGGKDFKPTSTIEIDSTDFTGADASKLTAIEDALFGSASAEPKLLSPAEIYAIINPESAG